MSTGIDEHRNRPTAVWFRASRASQKMDDGQPWTVDTLIERMLAEVDWAPSRPNYSTYENGHTIPKPPTMAKFYEFWKRYGIEPPDLNPPMAGTAVDPTVNAVPAALIKALTAQADAISELAAQVKALAEAQPTGEELANVLAAAVALAVRETLRAAGVVDGTPPK